MIELFTFLDFMEVNIGLFLLFYWQDVLGTLATDGVEEPLCFCLSHLFVLGT
jgi:hypothetical protein